MIQVLWQTLKCLLRVFSISHASAAVLGDIMCILEEFYKLAKEHKTVLNKVECGWELARFKQKINYYMDKVKATLKHCGKVQVMYFSKQGTDSVDRNLACVPELGKGTLALSLGHSEQEREETACDCLACQDMRQQLNLAEHLRSLTEELQKLLM
ncbi:putative agnoprotein [Betapolyomavirus mastomysis]|uniref:Agnoprotein n=1 Tax=Betapolyomavirus mastomysis TaxID=1891768 RepID=E5RUP0_9POLY|nr:putative agnoprotein [Betapolyomavirus mastomysis]BAJ53083.1 putative agnoprotein [Betapolyomavirus mastomysis]